MASGQLYAEQVGIPDNQEKAVSNTVTYESATATVEDVSFSSRYWNSGTNYVNPVDNASDLSSGI